MSTPDRFDGASQAAPDDALPGGAFDPALIARIANELFAAPPGPPAATDAAGIAEIPQVPDLDLKPEWEARLPDAMEFDADALASSLSGMTGLISTVPRVAPPVAPTARSAPEFYFLEGGRGGDPGPLANATPSTFDVHAVRRDFPILAERINGYSLVWLDSAATTQKPRMVIDAISSFYERSNSNIHRAAHTLAARATDAYEGAREKVRRFINAPSAREIVFVRGATEGINLVAQTWGRANIGKDDEIVITWLEHHSNIVPWQLLCAEKGARLRVAPVDDDGQIILAEYEKLLGPRTRLVALTQVSNALGTVTPARSMIEAAHRIGARVLVDGSQAVSHMEVDVQALDCDFYVFSGHKVFGPSGVGVVRGKLDLLDAMPPWQGGGNMIADVTFERVTYQSAPARFEAGTGNLADAVGLGAAIDYVSGIGLHNIARHEHALMDYATAGLRDIPRLRLIGTARDKAGVLSFVVGGVPSEQIGAALDRRGIAVRASHHCAQPALRRFGVESTVRPSLALYNTRADIDRLIDALSESVPRC